MLLCSVCIFQTQSFGTLKHMSHLGDEIKNSFALKIGRFTDDDTLMLVLRNLHISTWLKGGRNLQRDKKSITDPQSFGRGPKISSVSSTKTKNVKQCVVIY